METLTDRQKREVAYHETYAASFDDAHEPLNFAVPTSSHRRWWNAYWSVWSLLRAMPLAGANVLVMGCGAGADALYFAKLGARVYAFDLSAHMLAHAKRRARENGLDVVFEQMPAEKMSYSCATFDLVFARDVLHHVDIPATMDEVVRVSKPGAVFVLDEIYSHSFTNGIRYSRIVEKSLYPKMRRFIYGEDVPYITEDERKMSERDMAQVKARLSRVLCKRYYNLIVSRLLPERSNVINLIDRVLLMFLGPLGHLLAGRMVLVGTLRKL